MKRLNRITRLRTKRLLICYQDFNLIKTENTELSELKNILNSYVNNYLITFYQNFVPEFKYIIGVKTDTSCSNNWNSTLYCYLEFLTQIDITNPALKLKIEKDCKLNPFIFKNKNKKFNIYYQSLRSRKAIDPVIYQSQALWTNLNLNIASNKHFDDNWEYLANLLEQGQKKEVILKKLKKTDLHWFVLHIHKIELKINQYEKFVLHNNI